MIRLHEVCDYVNEKVDISEISINEYIANDNMLKDKKGIRIATIFPSNGKVIKFHTGDILVANIRPYFKKVWLSTFDGGCSQDVLVFRAKDNISCEFLYSILASDAFFDYVMLAPKGSKMPRGDKDHIMRYEVNIPSNYELIGKYICAISNKIVNNETLLLKYNELLSSYYHKIFYSSNLDGKLYFEEKINKKIPSNWEVYDFNHIPKTEIIKPGVDKFSIKNYLATANIIDEVVNEGNDITFDNREGRANMQPVLNSIWFAKMKDSVKRVCLSDKAQWYIDKYIMSTGFVGIKCEPIILEYLYSYIAFDDFELTKSRLAHGDTQQAINGNDLNNIYIAIPTDYILKKFHELAYPILQLKNNIMLENQKLYQLREFAFNYYI